MGGAPGLDDLLDHPRVSEEVVLAGPVGVMALHGGLEAETAEIAREAAERAGASLYVVSQPADLAWHVPSIRFDPARVPSLARFLVHVSRVVSLHGFGRRHLPRTVLVGGRNPDRRREAAQSLRSHSRLRVIADHETIPSRLRGIHPRNPVNLPSGGGAQLELSASARRAPHRADVVRAVTALLAGPDPGGASGTVPAP